VHRSGSVAVVPKRKFDTDAPSEEEVAARVRDELPHVVQQVSLGHHYLNIVIIIIIVVIIIIIITTIIRS
jgi:hypothetical protein